MLLCAIYYLLIIAILLILHTCYTTHGLRGILFLMDNIIYYLHNNMCMEFQENSLILNCMRINE